MTLFLKVPPTINAPQHKDTRYHVVARLIQSSQQKSLVFPSQILFPKSRTQESSAALKT